MPHPGELDGLFEDILDRLAAWANGQEDIRAVVIVGSRARDDRPADEWSDLDVILVANEPGLYVETTQWLRAMGSVAITFTELTPDGVTTERRVLYEGGVDVDFVPVSVDDFTNLLQDANAVVPTVLKRAHRFLVDKDGFTERVATFLDNVSDQPGDEGPNEEDFLNVVNDFWYHAVWVTKKLRRGEIWSALGGMNHLTWHCLLPVVEEHAAVKSGGETDTWHSGRFIEKWADPSVISKLPDALPAYGEQSIVDGLTSMMDVFHNSATELAKLHDWLYPTASELTARTLLIDWLSVPDSPEGT
jgi:aminoglycoside 6-adenylyltransferase